MKITRKEFIKNLWGFILLPYLLLLGLMASKHEKVSGSKEIKIPVDFQGDLHLEGDVICIRNENELTILSSRCTHLGCRIDKVSDGKLICPCHGSAFSLEGKPLNGPATRNLVPLEFYIDETTNEIVVTT
ncbi:MAG: Rieske (2Fe-2S) protein [Bacteroidales bacterium]